MRNLFALVLLAFHVVPAIAQDVTLTSRDGGLTVSGSLIKYDGEFYRIRSEYGDLTLDGSGVVCTGPGCPDLSAYVADTRFAGPAIFVDRLLPEIIDAFARTEGYDIELVKGSDGPSYFIQEGRDGRLVARFHVARVGNEEAFARLVASQADVAMTTRAVLPQEIEIAEQAGKGRLDSVFQEQVVALDAVVAVVSNSNAVDRVGYADLSRVFSGEISNWSELGGADAEIELHIPAPELAIRSVFLERLMLGDGRSFSPIAVSHTDLSELTASISGNPFALGLTRLSTLNGTRALEFSGNCGFAAVARPDTLKAEDFPLPAPLFFYRRSGNLPAVTRDFLRFSMTPAAQIAVLRAGFVDQTFGRISADRQGDRFGNAIRNAGGEIGLEDLQDLVSKIEGRDRLSMTFRFRPGSNSLDPQSRSNVRLLARALETGTLDVEKVTFVGFSDGLGNADRNLVLSNERATEVMDAVLRAGPTMDLSRLALAAIGLGEVMPLACDDADWGRNLNRRVEIWVE